MKPPQGVVVAALAALCLTGCGLTGEAPGAPNPGLAQRIVEEAEALRALLAGPRILQFPLIAGLGWAASRATQVALRIFWRLGLDPSRRLAAYRTIIDFLIGLIVAWAMVARLIRVAPILSLAGTGLGLAALTIALREQLQDVVVGLALVGRRRLREGDRVHIGEHSGTVHRVGLTRVELRRADGSAVHVPTRLLGGTALVVGHAKHTVPVTAVAADVRLPRARARECARRAALLSPYRSIGTPIDVKQRDGGRWQVEIHVWSHAAVRDAKVQLEQELARILESAEEMPREPTT